MRRIPTKSQVLWSWLVLCLPLLGFGQPPNDDCSAAQVLCSNVQIAGTTLGATAQCGGPDGDCMASGSWGQCYDVDNSVWYTFRTNAIGGAVQVTVSNSGCGPGLTLQGVLLAAAVPCDPTSYLAIDCDTGLAGGFVLNGISLSGNTQYWVQIDGGTSLPSLSACSFDIEVSGQAVAWQAQPAVLPESCNPGDDGSINLSMSGNFPPYTYAWSNGQSGSLIGNLSAGTYTATVTDAQGCDTVVSVVVPASDPITAVFQTPQPSSCTASTGSISIDSVSGGTPNYSYSIDGGANFQSGNSFTGLAAGTYSVIVQDQNGCMDTVTTTVSQPAPPQAVANVTEANCGEANGSLLVTAQGGSGPYTYTPPLAPGNAQGFYGGLAAGTYTIVVEDANGCSDTLVEVVPETDPVEARPVVTPIECQSTTGSIVITEVVGGTAPYTYTLNPGGTQFTPEFTELLTGTYEIVITDNRSCTANYTVTIPNLCPPVTVTNAFSPNGDGLNETWLLQNLSTYERCRVLVFNRWGQRVYRSTGYKVPWDGTNAGRTLPTGTYYYQITLDHEDPDADTFTGYLTLMR